MASVACAAPGPGTSVEDFFGKYLGCSIPALSEIPARMAAGDTNAANRMFADYVRATLDSRKVNAAWYKGRLTARGWERLRRDAEAIMDYRVSACGVPYHFRRIMELNGLLHVSMLFPFLSEARLWRESALAEFKAQLAEQVYPDGFQFELSPGYHSVIPNDYSSIIRLFRLCGEEPPGFVRSGIEKSYTSQRHRRNGYAHAGRRLDGIWIPVECRARRLQRGDSRVPRRTTCRHSSAPRKPLFMV